MRLFRRRKKNGEGVWIASWTEGGKTVRKSTRCSTKPAAELVVARWEREWADPLYAAANEATLGSETLVFLEECKQHVARGAMAPETQHMHKQKADNLLRLLNADTRLAALDATMVASYAAVRRSERGSRIGSLTSEATLYKEWVTLNQILKSARRRSRFDRDPATLRPARLTNNYTPKDRNLQPWEMMALLDALDRRSAAPVAFALATGARCKEVFASKAGDITGTFVHIHGTKTEGSDRRIPIPAPFLPLLHRALLKGPPFRKWKNSRRDILLACERAGIAPCTWNDFRRTFASRLIWDLGLTTTVVAKLLGHRTTAMVDKHYAKAGAESLSLLIEQQLRGRSQ